MSPLEQKTVNSRRLFRAGEERLRLKTKTSHPPLDPRPPNVERAVTSKRRDHHLRVPGVQPPCGTTVFFKQEVKSEAHRYTSERPSMLLLP
jgi:hypothetical protein